VGNLIKGTDLNLFFTLNGYSYPAAHATDCIIDLSAETQETTTQNGLKGKTFDYKGKYTYTLQLSGISNLIDLVNFSTFQDAILQSNKLLFIFTDSNNIQWAGTVLITNVNLDSPLSGISSFKNQMLGDGELTKVAHVLPPPPAGSSVVIKDQSGNTIATIQAPGQYNVLIFDTIQQGGANPVTPLLTITPA